MKLVSNSVRNSIYQLGEDWCYILPCSCTKAFNGFIQTKKDKYILKQNNCYLFFYLTPTQIKSDLWWLFLGRRMQIFCLPKNISLNFLQKTQTSQSLLTKPISWSFWNTDEYQVQLWIPSSPLHKTPFIDYPLRWRKRLSKIKTDSINSFHIYCSTTQPFKKKTSREKEFFAYPAYSLARWRKHTNVGSEWIKGLREGNNNKKKNKDG